MSYVKPVRQRTSRTSRSRIWPDGDLNTAAEVWKPVKRYRKINFFQTDADSCGRLLHQESTGRIQIYRTRKSRRRVLTPHHKMSSRHRQRSWKSDSRQWKWRRCPLSQRQNTFRRGQCRNRQSSETTEPRTRQPRLGERVYPTPLPMPPLTTSLP